MLVELCFVYADGWDQPRSNIFMLFDKLLLFAEGHVCYYGPASEAVQHFRTQGYPCPVEYNPADYFSTTDCVCEELFIDVRS